MIKTRLHKILHQIQKQRGYALLISAVLTSIIVSVIGLAVININVAMNNGTGNIIATQQAQLYAQNKANEIDCVNYSNISSIAQNRATITGTSFEREIIVGTETTVNSVKQTPVTINVYQSGKTSPQATLTLILTSAGSPPVTPSLHGKQVFTSSGTFTVPTGITKVWVSMCGGGGGGGTSIGGGGGGAAAVLLQAVTVTSGASITVTIGAGGAAASTGGTSSFGSYISCAGGGGSSNFYGGSAGGAGGANGGYTDYHFSMSMTPIYDWGANGGGCIFGDGGGGNRNTTGGVGGGYGAGGGGGGSAYSGGAGAPGVCVIEW